MSRTLRTSYRGWEIATRCLPLPSLLGSVGRQRRFASSAHAVLFKDQCPDAWVDCRPQKISMGAQVHDTTTTCGEVLLAEMKLLIDGLKK
ncbi:MAG: hypothetical protein QFF03_04725 [Pseudomonadota bacterium]|nr:hypothetical protein [Pseudomonadota bacterium]